jgi:hypothetical protein
MDQSQSTAFMENYKFKQFDFREFKKIQPLKSFSLFNVQTAELGTQPVLLITYNYFNRDINHIEELKQNTNFTKIRSRTILEKIGYIYENKYITIVYDRPEGNLLSFETPSYYQNSSDEVKFYIIDHILKIYLRIKRKVKHHFGYFSPSLFLFNPFLDTPIMMIEHSFLNIHGKLIDPMMKILFGYFKNTQYPSDFLMLLLFIVKFFAKLRKGDKDLDLDYEVLIYRLYLHIINKNTNTGYSFKNIVDNYIPNEQIKLLIQQYLDKGIALMNSTYDQEKESKLLEEFHNAFKIASERNFEQSKCVNCGYKAQQVSNICFEIVCNNCIKIHMCPKKALNNIQKNKSKADKNISIVNIMNNDYNNFARIHHKFDFSEITNIILNRFNEVFEKHTDILNCTNTKINEIVSLLDNNIKYGYKLIEKKHTLLLKKLEIFRRNGSIEEEIKQIIVTMQMVIENIEQSNKKIRDLDNSNFFGNLTEVPETYNIVLNHFRLYVLKPLFEEFFKSIKPFVLGEETIINPKNAFIVEGLIQKTQKENLYIPIYKTDKLIKIYNSFDEEVEHDRVEIICSFETDNSEICYFPDKCKYIRYNRFLFICGGLLTPEDEDSTPTDYCFILNLENNEVKIRKQMLTPKYLHSLCKFNRIHIIVVGGYNSNTCEKYSLTSDSWTRMPNLNKHRESCSLILYNKMMLYAFGGVYEKAYVDTIECLDLIKGTEWVEYSFDTESLRMPYYDVGICKIRNNSNCFLLLGGRGYNNEWNQNYYEINIPKLKITNKTLKTDKCCFMENKFIKFSKCYMQVGIGSDDREIIIKSEFE